METEGPGRGSPRCIPLLLALALLAAAAPAAPQAPREEPLAAGEVARIELVASIGRAIVFECTRPEVIADPLTRKAAWFQPPRDPHAWLVVAGEPAALPGLGEALVGMRPGERRQVPLAPEESFGTRDPALVDTIPRVQRLSRRLIAEPQNFVERFERFPVLGDTLAVDEFIRAEVLAVAPEEARLRLSPREPLLRETRRGLTEIRATEEQITIVVTPRVGVAWPGSGERAGQVVAVEDSTIRVDYNHPLAGKAVTYDIEVLERVPVDSLDAVSYPWRNDHDAALLEARRLGRPVFLLLCATWCTWTEELLVTTMEDPRIKVFHDRFVWVQIESDLYPEHRQRYGQTASPMIVLIDRDGDVAYRRQGFREAPELREAMLDCLAVE